MSKKDLVKKTIAVRGMFCTNCEKRITKALNGLSGVAEASADFQKGTATVSYDPSEVTEKMLEDAIRAEGYEIKTGADIQAVSVLVILMALYVIASHLGWTNIFNIFPRVETEVSLGMLFVIGLLTSVHCIAMCGGINLTQSTLSAAQKMTGRHSLSFSNALYNLGRVISYTVIGGLAGGLGKILSPGGMFKGVVAVIAGILMIIMALNMLGVFIPLRKLNIHLPDRLYGRLVSASGGKSSLVIGLLNGLMPCGPLQAMQLYALATGSVFRGALSMLIFSLGTVPLMFGLGISVSKLNRKYTRQMLMISAFLIFIMGIHMTGNGLSLSGVSTVSVRNDSAGMAMLDGDIQRLEMEIDYGTYPTFSVRAGIPVEWTIVVPEGKLNGCNGEILVPAYNLDIVLHEGRNTVNFTPGEAGIVPFSCWMGMIKSSINVVD